MRQTRSRMRRPPSYWWDFNHHEDGTMTIIIETDDPRVPDGVIRETAPLPDGGADHIIDAIMAEIKEYESGRKSVR